MEYSDIRFEDIPSEVHAKIFDYLTTKELLRTVARASKECARAVQDALLFSGAAPNSANIIVTGMHQAGCTSLTARIQEAFGVDNTLRNRMASSSDNIKAVRINDQNVHVSGVQLSSCIANVWHATTHPRQRKMMFHYYGISQLVVFVVPSQLNQNNKKDLKEALMALYSLAGHTNWIVVVNKMDLVNFSETEYNNAVATVQKCARKMMGQHVEQLTFVPVCATDTCQAVVSGSEQMSTWYRGPTLESELNARAVQYQVPPVKLVRKVNVSVVTVYGGLSAQCSDEGERTLVMAVYVLDGILRVGDVVEVVPPCSAMPRRNYHVWDTNLYSQNGPYEAIKKEHWGPAQVLELQYLAMSKQYALPNSYVGVKVKISKKIKPHYHRLQTLINPATAKPRVRSFEFHGLFNATLVHVAKKSHFNRKWDGLVKRGYSGGFSTVTLRGLITVEHFKTIYDRDGNELNMDEVEKKRGGKPAIERGEKADVILRVWCPMPFVFKESNSTYNYPDAYGRMIIYQDHSRVILVGVLHSLYTKLSLGSQQFINDANFLRAHKLTL